MSRGRPRHQASRRRAYSSRQRELRERRVRAPREEIWTGDGPAAFEIDEQLDFDAPGSWTTGSRPRGSAA